MATRISQLSDTKPRRSIHRGLPIAAACVLSVLGWQSTAYAVAFNGNVLGFQERQLYHSPETPGYTSWVGLWQLPNGTIQCDFAQLTAGGSQLSYPVLQSTDGAKTWSRVSGDIPTGSCRGMAVLNDGTMVRPMWNSDPNGAGYVQRSTDGGHTWGSPINFVSPTQYRAWPTSIKPLRDGRLVMMAGCWRRGDTTCGTRYDYPPDQAGMLPNMTKMMFLSSDGGKTWGNPISIIPTIAGVCEESDFVELPSGDLMWMNRSEHYPNSWAAISPLAVRMGPNPPESYWYTDRMQSFMHKQGDTFLTAGYGAAPFPHSGFPCELMTREGVILDLSTNGSHWSDDNGATWHNLILGGDSLNTYYYPRAVQAADGTIVVVGHRGHDDVYGTVDQAIMLQTFRLSAVPEPSALTLLGMGASCFLAYVWRRGRTTLRVRMPVRYALSSTIFSVFFAGVLAQAAEPPQDDAQVKAVDFLEKVIYHSPETPGYTSWVGLMQLPGGRIRCDFRQVTRPADKLISTVPVLESRDGGTTWTVLTVGSPTADPGSMGGYALSSDGCRVMAVLPDGTLVRGIWPSGSYPSVDVSDSGSVERSLDRGKTWGDRTYFLPREEYRTWPTLIRPLRDGRLVLFAGCWKRGDCSGGKRPDYPPGQEGMLPSMTKMMFVSSDKGKTWSKPIVLMPTTVGVCEESDFCELANGDLLWIHRTEHYPDHKTEIPPLALRMGPKPPESFWYSDRMQNIVRKQGDTFVAGKCEPAPFPHSGFTCLLPTREGVILHLAASGSHWSADEGRTWHKLLADNKPIDTYYYPKAIQTADGKIVCIGHRGGDDVYGTVDQAIVQQTFRLKVL